VGSAPDKPHVDSPRGALAPTELLWEGAISYGAPFEDPTGWRAALLTLAAEIPTPYRSRIGAIAIDGTSGTMSYDIIYLWVVFINWFYIFVYF